MAGARRVRGGAGARLNDDDEARSRAGGITCAPVDLYLACACARGVDGALERFERLYGDEIARTAQRFERPGLPADDLVQLLRAKLFTLPGGDGVQHARPTQRPRIAMYTGQGFLQNWLRVTTTRTFIDCCRGQPESPEVPIRNELVAVLPEPKGDPELQLLKREHVTHFKASFAEAVAALDGADRLLLKQHLVERLTIDQLGALYHLHRASAARRIAKAREACWSPRASRWRGASGCRPNGWPACWSWSRAGWKRASSGCWHDLRRTDVTAVGGGSLPVRQDVHAPARGRAVRTRSCRRCRRTATAARRAAARWRSWRAP